MYSERLLQHFRNSERVGSLEPPAVTVRVENPVCGDIMTVSVAVADGVVRDARFQVRGCTASIAAGSALADLLVGRACEDVRGIGADTVEAALGGLPNESRHAGRLACDAAAALATRL